MLISIIIPTYNRASIIGETLDSIMAQTYQNWECIVVDDGSNDDTADVMDGYINKDNRFQYIKRPEHRAKGPGSCRNYGFEKSKGDYINFFDSDDLLKAEAFEQWLNEFCNDEDAVICRTQKVDLKTGNTLEVNRIFSERLIEDYFTLELNFHVCGPLWKRSFLERQPYLFDEKIRNIDDWDFNLRMLYEKPRLAFIDDILIYYRMHPDSFSNEVKKLNKVEIASDFVARDKHLQLVQQRNDIDIKIINKHIVDRYKRYFKWAINQHADINLLTFLFKKLISKQIVFQDYKGAFKSSIGYFAVCLTGKGYIFFKD